ncbi:MAG: cytochrome c biogenesis protein CcsA [Euryarchaeota archaeon]|nr:cytochrome c biogenesis protein CcsA [Euryarchaeota archaeon]
MTSGRSIDRTLLVASTLGGVILLWLALVESPSLAGRENVTSPLAWKLFFFHVPAALASFIAFGVALISAVLYLRTRSTTWDHSTHAAAEVGVLLSGLTLATGLIWGKSEWNDAWDWTNAKLVMTLVLFLVFVAYLALRQNIPEPEKRARISSLYAIAGFAAVPLTWFAHRIWNTFPHPQPLEPQTTEQGITTPGIMPIFGFGVLVFILLFAALYRWRLQLLEAEARVEALSVATEVPA